MIRTASLLAALLLPFASASAQIKPQPGSSGASASALADALAHDRHSGMSVSADAYTDAARAKEKFGKSSPLAVGILPIEVVMRNDTSEPLRVNLGAIQLEVPVRGGRLQGVDWLSVEDVAIAITHPNGGPTPQAQRFPIGRPVPKADSKSQKVAEALQPLALNTDLVPPNGSIRGFLFFDVGKDLSVLDGASLYVPDVVSMESKKPLIFFEVLLGKP